MLRETRAAALAAARGGGRAVRAAVVVLPLVTSCSAAGGAAAPGQATVPAGPPIGGAAGVTGVAAAGSAGASGAPGAVATFAPQGAASRAPRGSAAVSATPSGAPAAPLRVTLGAGCVVPGGEQRLVVETLPGAFVAYDNLYPDGRDGQVHGGADGRARSDAAGRFAVTWRVAADTPVGRVRVDVGASAPGGSAITSAYYRLAVSCG